MLDTNTSPGSGYVNHTIHNLNTKITRWGSIVRNRNAREESEMIEQKENNL